MQRTHCFALALVLLLAGLFLSSPDARAQTPDSLRPVKRTYGMGDTEFVIAGAFHSWPNYDPTKPPGQWGPIDSLWAFAHAMGVDVIKAQLFNGVKDIDILATSRLRRPTDRMYVSVDPVDQAGWGREIVFFPFDSVQSPYFPCRFLDLSGGNPDIVNPYVRDRSGRPARERIYNSFNTTPGRLVASQIAFGWKPTQKYRYAYYGRENTGGRRVDRFHNEVDYYPPLTFRRNPQTGRTDTVFDPAAALRDSVQNHFTILSFIREQTGPKTHWVTVTGHLFINGPARDDDSVLRIEVWHQIPYGSTYRTGPSTVVRADTNMERRCATIMVRKRDLRPRPGSGWSDYQEVSFPVDLVSCPECAGGPLDPGATARGIDLRVYWTGAETVGLRSIAMRDSLGELVLGRSPRSILYRRQIVDNAARVLRGVDGKGPLRPALIRLYSGDEPAFTEYAGYVAVDSLIRSNFNRGKAQGDSVMLVNVVGATARNFNHFAQPDAFYIQTYQLVLPHDTTRAFGGNPDGPNVWYQVPYHTLPTIREHNGGRYHIPLLPETPRGVEDYATTFQYAYVGQYTPRFMPWPYNKLMAYELGDAATVARDTRRRMNLELGLHGSVFVRAKQDAPGAAKYLHDTLVSHVVEPAEIRTMANMAMAYGARGVWYYWFGSTPNFLHRERIGDSLFFVGGTDGIGSNGLRLRDTVMDYGYPFVFTTPDGTPGVALDSFYIGWRTRTQAVKRLNTWLRAVGPELTKLRWRDAYSIHFSAVRPYVWEKRHPVRPLPADEIVTRVTTRSPVTRAVDSLWATYVELGLFQPQRGMRGSVVDPVLDTNHIFVVNRRTFERPAEITNPVRARRLDSLAEQRTIALRLNLPSPAAGVDRVRIREIAPDTTPLPLTNVPRAPLDVTTSIKGTIELTLGPGRAALLEITYVR